MRNRTWGGKNNVMYTAIPRKFRKHSGIILVLFVFSCSIGFSSFVLRNTNRASESEDTQNNTNVIAPKWIVNRTSRSLTQRPKKDQSLFNPDSEVKKPAKEYYERIEPQDFEYYEKDPGRTGLLDLGHNESELPKFEVRFNKYRALDFAPETFRGFQLDPLFNVTKALDSGYKQSTRCSGELRDDLNQEKKFPVVQRDIEAAANPKSIVLKRLERFDYEEVHGLVAMFSRAYIAGSEPCVFDCRLIYRPGGSADGSPNYNYFAQGAKARKVVTAVRSGDHAVIESTVEQKIPDSVPYLPGTYVLIASLWTQRYYHWLIESVPRIAMVYDYLIENPAVTIVMHKPPGEGLWDITSLLGLPRDRFLEHRDSPRLYEQLLVPTATAEGRSNHRAVRWLRLKLRSALAEQFSVREMYLKSLKSTKNRPLNIVVQVREKSRSLLNHEYLMKSIRDSFPSANVSEYSKNNTISEMMEMHYFADILVGPHGAGLSNSVFMRRKSGILEIYMKNGMMGAKDWYNPCHQYTATALDIQYEMIRANSGSHSTAMVANIPKTIAALGRLIDRIKLP